MKHKYHIVITLQNCNENNLEVINISYCTFTLKDNYFFPVLFRVIQSIREISRDHFQRLEGINMVFWLRR